LPQPLGPTMQVIPLPLKVIWVFSQNDLKPKRSTLRSLSTLSLEPDFVSARGRAERRLFLQLRWRCSETKSLEGRWSVALPPGACVSAVTGEEDSIGGGGCKGYTHKLCL